MEFRNWDAIDGSSVPKQETQDAFREVMRSASKIEAAHKERIMIKRNRGIIRWAAVLAAVLLSSTLSYLVVSVNRAEGSEGIFCECIVPEGSIKEVVLSDGSKVILNSGSTLIYPEKFGKRRSVYLSGEANFDVTADKKSPFTVNASGISVTALGTKFNVRAYPFDNTTSTTLLRGTVSVISGTQDEEAAVLKPGERCICDVTAGTKQVGRVNAEEVLAWEDGGIRLISQPLKEAMKTIGRRYGVNIMIMTDKFDDAVITAKFINGETIEEILDSVRHLVPGLQYEIDGININIR